MSISPWFFCYWGWSIHHPPPPHNKRTALKSIPMGPRKIILRKWVVAMSWKLRDLHGYYGIYMAVTGSTWLLRGTRGNRSGKRHAWLRKSREDPLYAVNAQTSLAPLSRFRGSHITTAHEQQCCRFQSYAKAVPSPMKLTSEIDKAWTTFLGSTTTDHLITACQALWRLTLTAYCHVNP